MDKAAVNGAIRCGQRGRWGGGRRGATLCNPHPRTQAPGTPGRFTGAVVVEPFSFGGERAGGWTKIRKHLLAYGHAWIGITLMGKEERSANPAGRAALRD